MTLRPHAQGCTSISLYLADAATLERILRSTLLPATVKAAPLRWCGDAQQGWYLEPAKPLKAAQLKAARQLGVPEQTPPADARWQESPHWWQLLPLVPIAGAVPPVTGQAVLFLVPTGEPWQQLTSELLRLGNDRQSVRWITLGTQTWALVRVVDPPYYTLAQALSPHPDRHLVAFTQAAPQVWLPLGWTYPLLEFLAPPLGETWLLRPPHDWLALADAPFAELYEHAEIELPAPAVRADASPFQERLAVPLRLVPGRDEVRPELWVLTARELPQLEALVRHSDQRVVDRLAFAAGTFAGESLVIVRLRPGKAAPPVVLLEAAAYRVYAKLPQLFAPVGLRVHPPLRRDVLATTLAPDTSLVTWLQPHGSEATAGEFTPISVPESAFRPLGEWVEYVLSQAAAPLQSWVQASTFDFEPFICRDEPGPVKPRASEPELVDENPPEPEPLPFTPPVVRPGKKARRGSNLPELQFAPPERKSAQQARLAELQIQFVASRAAADAPERVQQWIGMAQLHSELNHATDGTLCWLASLWLQPQPTTAAATAWFAHETGALPSLDWFATQPVGWLTRSNWTSSEIAALAAFLHWCSTLPQVSTEITQALPLLATVALRNEHELPLRGNWLLWTSLARLSGGDVLAVARARDRMLERLHSRGVSAQLDLPSFLRGTEQGVRGTLAADRLLELQTRVQHWLSRQGALANNPTGCYIDLIFAWGLARRGAHKEARQLARAASQRLPRLDQVHRCLAEAFEFRIRELEHGEPPSVQLPAEWLTRVEQLDRIDRYKVDALRQKLRILEPHARIDPYRDWFGRARDAFARRISALWDIHDRHALATEFTALREELSLTTTELPQQAKLVSTALELAPRLGQQVAADWLDLAANLLTADLEWADRLQVVEKAIALAAHFDLQRWVRHFLEQCEAVLLRAPRTAPREALCSLLSQCFRNLRRLGLRDEIDRLLQAVVLGLGVSAPSGPAEWDTYDEQQADGQQLQLLLAVAGVWRYFGRDAQAEPTLQRAQRLLVHGELDKLDQTQLACALVAAIVQSGPDHALPLLSELFTDLDRVYDLLSTTSHFSKAQLTLIETMVVGLVGETSAVDPTVQRWLDDEEYLLRRRLQADLQAVLTPQPEPVSTRTAPPWSTPNTALPGRVPASPSGA